MLQVSAGGNERDNRHFRLDFAFFQKEPFFNGLLGHPEGIAYMEPFQHPLSLLPEWTQIRVIRCRV
jgi:hypothetical protein